MVEFIWDSYITLNKCREIIEKQITGAYLRFGDGDVFLREGGDDMLQGGNPKIAEEMKEAFSLTGKGIIKSLPLHSDKYGCMPKMSPGVHKWDNGFAESLLSSSIKYFENETIYSPVALHYLGVYDRDFTIEFLRFIRKFKPIFVGNQNIPEDVVYKLFDAPIHIKTPPSDSFSQIDRIESETLIELDKHMNDYQVIVIATGGSGRVLTKRILKKQKYKVFLFDFGSLLDALCGWGTRAWIDLANVPPSYWEDMLNEISSS
ncbi:hypothetical protein [Pseudoneobacillus sp. C159]